MLIYCLLVVCTAHLVRGETYKHISVRDASGGLEQHPDALHVTIDSHEGPVKLRLRRSEHLHEIPRYTLEDGRLKREAPDNFDVALYQDKRHMASVAVRSVREAGSPLYKRSLRGSLLINGAEYEIAPQKRSADDEETPEEPQIPKLPDLDDEKDEKDKDKKDKNKKGKDKDDDDPSEHIPESRKRRGANEEAEEPQIPKLPDLNDVKEKDEKDADDDDDDDSKHIPENKRDVSHTLTKFEQKRGIKDHGSIPVPLHEVRRQTLLARRAAGRHISKRTTGAVNFGLELLIGCDYSIYQKFNQNTTAIHEYFALMAKGMDMRYESIESADIKIFIRVAGIIIATSASQYPWTDSNTVDPPSGSRKLVDASAALGRMKDWDWSQKSSNPEHDHFMVFTNYDIYTEYQGQKQTSVAGLAYSRATCGNYSQSITEAHGGLANIGVAAHELGHSLGADDHDGSGDASSCSGNDQYIMAAVSGSASGDNVQNPWRFSTCSIAQMVEYLITEKKGESCLHSNATHSSSLSLDAHMQKLPGQIWNPDAQCKSIYAGGYYCGGASKDAVICQTLFCWNPATSQCTSSGPAMRGTTCGNKKWCNTGVCVAHDDAPAADDSCIHGGYKAPFSGSGQTCSQLATLSFCRSNSAVCCGPCNAIKLNITDCPWGDMTPQCAEPYCATSFKSYCCKTCHGV